MEGEYKVDVKRILGFRLKGNQAETPQGGRELANLPIGDIRPNPSQMRQKIDGDDLTELAESIKSLGVIQPIVVRPLEEGYELVAGERRLRAAKMAGLEFIPAIVVNMDDLASSLSALVENIQRKDLSAIEEARCLADLLRTTGWTQVELAKRLGRSQAALANKLRLLQLDEDVQEMVVDGKLSERQARALLSLPIEVQREVADMICRNEVKIEDLGHTGRRRRKKERLIELGQRGELGDILLQKLSEVVQEARKSGIPVAWRIKEFAHSRLVMEITVDLKKDETIDDSKS
ncbi:MAG: ParB/RepB/Spo0J family partition protein [Synergistota bacterium]|nr:ParB/RepB/Spo0J family partition protein [Synergistota bacterium]HHV53181.1 ParB/RepB/Spo0J family partition protein [Synergistaceae bacterium]